MFDIYQLDKEDSHSIESEKDLHSYLDTLMRLFNKSPEGRDHQKMYPEIGFWVAQLIYYGYAYMGVTIPHMAVVDVEEIISNLFPRKISLTSLDEAKGALPELIAFWSYLGREYKLSNAKDILEYLMSIKEVEFIKMMNNPSRFGMAKSFVIAGQQAGFDMTN